MPAGQDGHGDSVGGQRRAVSRAVDAVGAAGDDRDVVFGQPGRQVGGDMLAVGGRGSGSDDGGRALRRLVEARGTQCPQHQRRPAPGLDSGTGERGEREQRPLVVVGCDQPSAAAAPATRDRLRRSLFRAWPRCAGPASSSTSPRRTRSAASTGPNGLHQGGELGARRFGHPRQIGPCRDVVARVIAALPVAGSSARRRPRRARRLTRPARSARLHATRNVRSTPRMLSSPRSSAVRNGVHRGVAGAELSPQQRPADFGVGAEPVRPPALGGRVARRRHPVAHLRRGLAVDGRNCACANRIHLHPQIHPVQQRPGELAQVATFDRRRADAVAADRPARRGTDWRPAPAGIGRDSTPPRRGGPGESRRPPTAFAALPAR